MKTVLRPLVLILAAFGISGVSPAQDEKKDAAQEPQSITLLTEWIEMEQADLRKLLLDDQILLEGHQLREEIRSLTEDGRADIIEALAIRARPGQRGKTESIEELVYPSEYDPPETNSTGEGVTPPCPAAFESRNLGFTVEFDSSWATSALIGLTLNIERVAFLGMKKWTQQEYLYQMPEIYTIRDNSSCLLRSERYRLIGTHTPHAPSDPKRKDPRVLVFVRANFAHPPPKQAGLLAKRPTQDEAAFLFETIETTQIRLNELLYEEKLSMRGPELYQALLQDVSSGAATAVDTSLVTGRTGQKMKLESVLESIYPSEYDGPFLSDNGARIIASSPAAWETRHVGRSFEIDCGRRDGEYLEVSIKPEHTALIDHIFWGKEEARERYPVFHQQTTSIDSWMLNGERFLVGSFLPPKPAAKDRSGSIRLLFVRAEVWSAK